MKYIVILAVILTGCISSPTTVDQITNTDYVPATVWDDYYSGGYNFFTDIPGSDYIMVPLGSRKDEKSSREFSLKSGDNSSFIRNYVFCNLKTGVQRLLTDSCSFYFEQAIPVYFPYKNDIPGAILYYLRNNDFNNDKAIDYADTRHLYISDTDGKNFRPVTPLEMHVENFYFPKDSATLILSCMTDTDKDLKYTSADVSVLYTFKWPFSNNLDKLFSNETDAAIKKMADNCSKAPEK